MPREKIYRCCICHKILDKYKPIRLVKQLYGRKIGKPYLQYWNMGNYDFCKVCYVRFDRWVKKHNEEENNNG